MRGYTPALASPRGAVLTLLVTAHSHTDTTESLSHDSGKVIEVGAVISAPAATTIRHPVRPRLPRQPSRSIPSSHSSAPLPQIFSLFILALPALAEKNLVCGLYIFLVSHEDQDSHGHRSSPSSGSSLTVRTREISHKSYCDPDLEYGTHSNDSDEGDRGIVRKAKVTVKLRCC